jgi:NHLM bacteriocin system ABC transporter peptidase/ATP-binding protein
MAVTSPSQPKKTSDHRRIKTPTVLQMEAVECGAASLGIVLGYFGKFVPLEELRVACGVSRDGSKASNISKAARSYGLEVKAYRKEPAGLRDLPLPQIVFWNFYHFLVVEGFGPDKVYLNDPATGPRTVTNEQFDRAFTGVVLTFQAGERFEKGGAPAGMVKTLRGRLQGLEAALAYAILAGIALVAPALAIPIFTQIFVDSVLVHSMRAWVGPLVIGLTITAVLRGAFTYLQQRCLLLLETKLALTMSGKFFWHVLRLPMEFYSQRSAGDVGTRVAINDRVANLLSGQLATTALSVLTLLFYVALMLRYDVGLTLIGVLFAALNIAALRLVSRRRADLNQRVLMERAKLLSTSMTGLQRIETLKVTGGENDFFTRWAGFQATLVNVEQDFALPTQFLTAVPTLLAGIATAVVLGVGGYRVMQGAMSVGMLVAFQSLMAGFSAPIASLVGLGSMLQEVDGDLKRLEDVLEYPLDRVAASPATGAAEMAEASSEPPTLLTGRLELRNITFGYSRLDKPLIEDLSLTLKPGSRVALVGGSGSGKSTISRLVAGLMQPWDGEILFDGRPRTKIPRATLIRSVGLVDQEIFLFAGTVRENLTLWDDTIPEPQILQATKDACIHREIAARPGGYESQVAEDGTNFSGGQRQRLEIARALVRNPTLLILDEATSALDPQTEQRIDENLRRRGCTCLIVAHRLSTIRDCDEILVMEEGKVVQRGTHAQMSRQDGPYSRLLETRETKSRRSYLDFA